MNLLSPVLSTSRSTEMIFSVLLGLILTVPYVKGAAQCPVHANERIQLCVQPVAEYAKVLNQQEGSNESRKSEFGQAIQLPKLGGGGQVFSRLCRLIRNFDSCVLDFRKICPNHITISLIDASYGYLCNDGYDTFMRSAECLMELDQRPSVKRCHDETLSDIEKANGESGITMPAKLDRMCDALNFFSGCVRSPIRHNCGVEAWQVIFRVLKDTTKTLMPACHFTGTSPRLLNHRVHHSLAPIHVTAAPLPPRTTAVISRLEEEPSVVGITESADSSDVLVEESSEEEEPREAADGPFSSHRTPHKVLVNSAPGQHSSYTSDPDDSSSAPHQHASLFVASILPLLVIAYL